MNALHGAYSRLLAIRWTIGDVSELGFESLRLSVWGAFRLFGPRAAYVICVNTLPVDRARELAGQLPPAVAWRDVNGEIPAFLRPHVDGGFAEGVIWKLAPLRLFPDRFELSLDNDCILWDCPGAVREWLAGGSRRACVLAEDVRTCLGQFTHLCGPEPRNSGIRGLPPGFDLQPAIEEVLRIAPVRLVSELDEQGLQVAALSRMLAPLIVTTGEVTICSPFPPHEPRLGQVGAHFVGLNAKKLPWTYRGRSGELYIRDNWRRLRPALYRRVGIARPHPAPQAAALPAPSRPWSARPASHEAGPRGRRARATDRKRT